MNVYENFDNIYKFMDIIEKRPNNGKFGQSSQKESSDGWSGTRTYKEAVEQFSNGLPETCERMKKSLERFKANANVSQNKARPRNYYHGYTPNIPAAIMGLPKSMRQIERTPQKVKAISIMYDASANCGTSADTLNKAGCTVLELVYALEVKGYRVRLDLLPFTSKDGEEVVCAITLKDWRQPLDLLKLSFPLTSPAMFRRFGFKWAEGIPGVEKHFCSYGRTLTKDACRKLMEAHGVKTDNAYFIDVRDCQKADFDALKVADALGIKRG